MRIRDTSCSVCWLLLLLLSLALPAGGQKPPPPKKSPSRGPAAEIAAPFREGELLEYRASWENFLTAAVISLRAVERAERDSRMSWHFQATAQTIAPVRYLYTVDDRFESWADAAQLASRVYESHRHEPGKQDDRTVRFAYDGEPADGHGVVRISRDTRDPIAALFYLRTLDWPHKKDSRFKVYDGEKLYDVHARLEAANESVVTAAGTVSATRLAFRVFEQEKERSDIKIRLWLGNDDARTPVLIEAELPFGRVRVELSRRSQP